MQRSVGALPPLEMRNISLLKRSSGVSAAGTPPEGSRGMFTRTGRAGLVSPLLLAENVWPWPSGHVCFSDLSTVEAWRTEAAKQCAHAGKHATYV